MFPFGNETQILQKEQKLGVTGYFCADLQTYFTAILESLLLSRRHTKPGYLYKYCLTVGEVSPSMVFF